MIQLPLLNFGNFLYLSLVKYFVEIPYFQRRSQNLFIQLISSWFLAHPSFQLH